MTSLLFLPRTENVTGAYVYPRLPRRAARILIEERSGWTAVQLRKAGRTSHPNAAPAPMGKAVPPARLVRAQETVRKALGSVEPVFPWPVPRTRAAEFDRIIGRHLYEQLAILPGDAASEGVWTFLTLVLLPEIGPWRFPDAGEKRYLGVPRNVLRRTWWRAHILGPELGGAPASSPPLGEDELVQIFERPTLSANPHVARAIVSAVHRYGPDLPGARSEFMRDLTRRLLRLTPVLCLDALSEERLDHLVDRLAEESRSALD